jgi:hypothetical protein
MIAEHLIELANTAGYTDEDMAIIEDAMERGAQTLLEKLASVIDAAIEGTASFEDLTSLAINAGIDLRGKVLKTAKGYGLTQEGMLAVSAARAGLSGDYTGEA